MHSSCSDDIQMTSKPTETGVDHYLLRLFVSGRTERSEQAIVNLESICARELRGRYRLEVIDVLDDLSAAEEAMIIVTPTLLKQLPPPISRIIGDLSDREAVLLGLDLVGAESERPPR